MGRRSSRNRPRGGTVVKARQSRPPAGAAATFSSDQVAAIMSAASQQWASGQLANPLPRPPQWSSDPFAPGNPLRPAPINAPRKDTGRAEPRLFELPISTNINIGTAPYVPWRILQEAADMPLFRKCIERRKSVCQLDFVVTVDPKAVAREADMAGQAKTDVESALRQKYMPDISRITDWLQTPDRGNGYDWDQWTGLLMENRLKYDATVIYPRRTYGGDVFSFEIIDGKTIKPLMDERGGRPLPPSPFAQQILYGFPRGEYIADAEIGLDGKPFIPGGYASDQLLYERTIIRPETPYGMSATEIALLDGIVWMRRMGWILAEYTEGVTPAALLETSPDSDWTVPQWEEWLRGINDHLGGNTAERNKFALFPPGVHVVEPSTVGEKYAPDYDLFLIKLIAGDFGLPASEIGFTEAGALGASFHEGEEDILNRQTRRPDAQWIGSIATKLAIRQLGMPNVLQVQVLGLESEDEAAADAVAQSQVESARLTLNEDRARRGLPPFSFPEADMAMQVTTRGVVFLDGASQLGAPGTLITPPQAPPAISQAAPDGSSPDDGAEPDRGQGDGGPPVSKAVELAALRKWTARHPAPGRQFACKALTAADVPAMAGDPRIVFKDASPPKVPAGTGPAGSGTASS